MTASVCCEASPAGEQCLQSAFADGIMSVFIYIRLCHITIYLELFFIIIVIMHRTLLYHVIMLLLQTQCSMDTQLDLQR